MTRRTDPPTRKQLLNLADRSERGPLTPAEAARLRQGITAMAFSRSSATNRLTEALRRQRQTDRQLAAVVRLVRKAQQRGGRTIHVRALARELDDALVEAA